MRGWNHDRETQKRVAKASNHQAGAASNVDENHLLLRWRAGAHDNLNDWRVDMAMVSHGRA